MSQLEEGLRYNGMEEMRLRYGRKRQVFVVSAEFDPRPTCTKMAEVAV